ncbi:MAG: hypothetical protein QM802_19850 [Agriterribacter sp.]
MEKTNEVIQMESHETITQKRIVFSVKEIIGAISFIIIMASAWSAIEIRFKEIEMKIEQFEKNNLNTSLKFDKIDQKLDAIQNDVIDIKLKAPVKNNDNHN